MTRHSSQDIATKTMRNVMIVIALILLTHTVAHSFASYSQLLDRRLDELMDISVMLAANLDEQTLSLLKQPTANGTPTRELVTTINKALQPYADECAARYPGIGVGLYSRSLDSIVAVIPFSDEYLIPFAPDSPLLRSYSTLKPERMTTKTSISWDGLPLAAVTYPLIRNGQVIGHAWACRRLGDLVWDAAWRTLWLVTLYALAAIAIYRVLRTYFGELRRGISRIGADAISGRRSDSPILPELAELVHAFGKTRTLFERLFQLSIDPICIFNRSGVLLSTNPAFQKMVGVSAGELIGRKVYDFVSEEDAEKSGLGGELLNGGQTISNWDLRFAHVDGHLRQTSWSCVPDLETGTIYAVARDETELRQLREQMLRLDRLDLAGQMAAAISHEIRNPMTTIRGYLQLMKVRYKETIDAERLELMIDELDRANGIISEFLALSRAHKPTKRTGNINTVISRLRPLLEADCVMKGCDLKLDLRSIPDLLFDEKEIRQMLLNLARNSLDAMPSGGALTIRTSTEGSTVKLAVEDQGCGIPEHVLSRIWDPFFTTKESGTGLGLAICYRIAANNNATISVAETNLNGTRIEVKFAP